MASRRQHRAWQQVHLVASSLSSPPFSEAGPPLYVIPLDPVARKTNQSQAKDGKPCSGASVDVMTLARIPALTKEAPAILTMLRIDHELFWVIPDRVALSCSLHQAGTPLRRSINLAHIGAIADFRSSRMASVASPDGRRLPIRQIPYRVSDKRTLVDSIHDIIKNEHHALLLRCPTDDGWDLAAAALLMRCLAGLSARAALSRLRAFCDVFSKRWTMRSAIETCVRSVSKTDLPEIKLHEQPSSKPGQSPPTSVLRVAGTPVAVPVRPHTASSARVIAHSGNSSTSGQDRPCSAAPALESRRLVASRLSQR